MESHPFWEGRSSVAKDESGIEFKRFIFLIQTHNPYKVTNLAPVNSKIQFVEDNKPRKKN